VLPAHRPIVRPLVRTLLVVGIAAPLLLAARTARTASVPATVQVTVNARCAGPNSTEITVRPWNVRLQQGDEVEWVLSANANTNALTITPKASSDWPFAARGPYASTRGNSARANGMRANGRGSYKYDISLICQAGNSAPDTVVVDPDIIVD
jgi:plastocyanin